MNRIFKSSLLLTGSLMLVACVTKSPMQLPPERPLPEAEVVPTDAELNGNPLNVWVYIQSDKKSDELKLERDVLNRWMEAMRKTGVTLHEAPKKSRTIFGRLVDLESPEQGTLKELIEHAGYGSNGEYQGKQTVDYVMEVKVNRSTYGFQYDAPLLDTNPLTDKRNPGSCDYEMEAHLDINLKPLPEYRTLKSFWLETEESDDAEVFDRCAHKNHYTAKNIYKQLRKDTLEQIGDCGGVALQKFLTPSGYILNYFSDGKEHIFEISGGTAAGFDDGQTLEIHRIGDLGKHHGDLLGEATVEEVKPKRSLISVSDPTLVEQIMKYDLVKVKSGNVLSNTYNAVSCSGNITEL